MSNSQSIEEIWRRYDADEQRLTAFVSQRMVDLAQLQPGMRVLDLATGRGEPAIAAAERVGPNGHVVGIDLSDSMLSMTRTRAQTLGINKLRLIVGDAQSLEGVPPVQFNAVLARWGLMYMVDPVRALIAARHRCGPEARLVAGMWAEPERVDYLHVPSRLLERYMPLPTVAPDSPGTFRYADPAIIHRDFAAAGWHIEALEEVYVPVMEAGSADQLVHWCECFGMNRLMKDLPEQTRESWRQDLRSQFPSLTGADGFARLGGITRLVTAKSLGANPERTTELLGASLASAQRFFRLHGPTLPKSFSAPLFLCVSRFLRVSNRPC